MKKKKNLTEYVRSYVIRKILEGVYLPGVKIPSEREMTKITKTSRVTVRRAYGQLENAGIINRNRCDGTTISTILRANTDTVTEVALITSVRDPFAIDFMETAEKVIKEYDALLIVAFNERAQDEISSALRFASRGIKNMIVWSSGTHKNNELFTRLRILGVNIVFFDRIIPGQFADFVGLDNLHAIRTIMKDTEKYAASTYLFLDYDDIGFDSNRERHEEFIRICEQNRYNYEEIYFSYYDKSKDEEGLSKIRQIISLQRLKNSPVVIAVNDTLALKVKNECGDKPVYGIDGNPEALSKGIISYSQPIAEMAEECVRCLNAQSLPGSKWKASEKRIKGRLKKCSFSHPAGA